MALRDLTLDLLRQKRWELFAEPDSDEEWWDKVGRAGQGKGREGKGQGGQEGGEDSMYLGGMVAGEGLQGGWLSRGHARLRAAAAGRQADSAVSPRFSCQPHAGASKQAGALAWPAFQPVPPPHPTVYRPLRQVSEPMDLASILSRVDARAYSTTHDYLADVAKIAQVGESLLCSASQPHPHAPNPFLHLRWRAGCS